MPDNPNSEQKRSEGEPNRLHMPTRKLRLIISYASTHLECGHLHRAMGPPPALASGSLNLAGGWPPEGSGRHPSIITHLRKRNIVSSAGFSRRTICTTSSSASLSGPTVNARSVSLLDQSSDTSRSSRHPLETEVPQILEQYRVVQLGQYVCVNCENGLHLEILHTPHARFVSSHPSPVRDQGIDSAFPGMIGTRSFIFQGFHSPRLKQNDTDT